MSVPTITAALAKGLTNDNRGIISEPDARKIAAEFKKTVMGETGVSAARQAYAKAEKFIDMAEMAARAPSARTTLTSARQAANSHLQDLVDIRNDLATQTQICSAAREFVMEQFAQQPGWPTPIDPEILFHPNHRWSDRALDQITNELDPASYSNVDDNIMMVQVRFGDPEARCGVVKINVAVDRTDAKVLGYYDHYQFTPVS